MRVICYEFNATTLCGNNYIKYLLFHRFSYLPTQLPLLFDSFLSSKFLEIKPAKKPQSI